MLIVANKFQTGYDEPLLQTMYVDKGLSDIKAVQTLSRLNRCYPNKNEVFVLDFQNDPADIKTAFDKYYKTTILSGETDVNKLNDLVDEMEPLDVYSDEEVTEVAELYLDNADRTKIDPIIDKGTERYKELEYDDQVDFKSSAKTFLRTYNFLSSILPYGSMDWERLSIYLTFLVSKLPKPDNGNADEIVEDVELESYRLVAQDALRILAKRQNKAYEKEQNRFEDIQKKKIIDKINSKYLVAKNITREQQIRPGMDAIVYDKEKKHLQVIELKYKLPIESTSDLINLDAMLNKAYNQIKIAEEMVEENKTFILEEYFGESFKGIIPDFVDYFVITNYSVGTGRNCILPSPIILESHYLSMMKLNNGMYNVHYALSDNGKGYIQHVEKRYARYLLSGYKIMVPEYLFKINAPRL